MDTRKTYNRLFNELLPSKIRVADQLPSDPNFSVMELSIGEFQKKMNMHWCETILYEKPLVTEENKQRAFPPISEKKLIELLQQSLETRNRLTICYMGPQLGYGLYGSVKKDEVIGFYTGVEKSFALKKEDEDTSYQIEALDINQNSFGYIDAIEFGNHTRYIQHAWERPANENHSDEFHAIHSQDVQFHHSSQKQNLTVANIEIAGCTYGAQELLLLSAAEDIDGWIMMSYGNYWFSQNKMPALIDLKGQIIPQEEYYYSRIHVGIHLNSQITLYSYLNENQVAELKQLPYVTNVEKQLPGIKEVKLFAKDFRQGLADKDPNSIFVLFKKPSHITYQPNVIGQLQSFTEKFGIGLDWKYNKKAKTAWLENADNDIKHQLKDFFIGHGFTASLPTNKKTGETMVYLKDVDINTFNRTETFQLKK